MSYGTGKYKYDLEDGWAKYPKDWTLLDVAGITIDAQDRVYVFNRGPHPLIVFDREGNLLTSWGEGLFHRAHGSCIGPDGSIYCTDDDNHMVRKLSTQWGTAGLNRDKALFLATHTIAVDSRGDLYVGEVVWTAYGIDKGPRTIQKFIRNT